MSKSRIGLVDDIADSVIEKFDGHVDRFEVARLLANIFVSCSMDILQAIEVCGDACVMLSHFNSEDDGPEKPVVQ